MTAALVELPRLQREVPDWHQDGLCRSFPELSWVHPGAVDAWDKPDKEDREVAEVACRLICSACPVRLACAVGALERREPYGIWGGLDREDRKKIAPRYGYPIPGDPPAHGTDARYKKWHCRCPECKAGHALYEAMRREGKRPVEPSAFARRLAELKADSGLSYVTLARVTGLNPERVRSLTIGQTKPTADMVTALVRAYADDPAERARLAEELHQLAGTAVGVTRVGDRRVLVMAGSRHDLEVRHLRALPDGPTIGESVQRRSRVDRADYRRRSRSRVRRRR